MKKLVLIALALITLQATAQDRKREHAPENRKERGKQMMQFSPEEVAKIQTKKITLHLDLNESQQAKIHKINLENATKRKAMMEARKTKKENSSTKRPSKDERLQMMNIKLDHQIAMKAKMKKILNDEQYAKWEKAQAKKSHKSKGKNKNRDRKKR